MATASTIVDLPEPFSPTRNVTPLSRVEPLAAAAARPQGWSSATRRGAAAAPSARDTRTTGGWSKSTRSRYGLASRRTASVPSWPRRSRPSVEIEVDNRVVRVSNPDRVYFPESGATKLDLVEYYLAVGPGIVNALRERPCMLHRFPKGLADKKVHQKRLPAGAPDWVETVQLYFPRWGRTADELCVTELGSVIWAVQMSTVEFHPWNSRRADTEKPDEWRIDLDPGDECDYATVQRVAHVAHEVLDELGAVGFPKTSRRQGDARLRADPPRARLQGRTPRARWPSRARSSGVRRTTSRPPGGARTATRASCSWTTTRTPATTPSPRRTPCAACPTPGSRPRSTGTRSTTPTRTTSRSSPCPSASPRRATCTRPSTSTSSTSRPLLEWAERDEAEGKETPDEPETD